MTEAEHESGADEAHAELVPLLAEPELPPDALVVLPVRGVVLFPGFLSQVTIGRAGSIAAAQHAVRHEQQLVIAAQRDPSLDLPEARITSYNVCYTKLLRSCSSCRAAAIAPMRWVTSMPITSHGPSTSAGSQFSRSSTQRVSPSAAETCIVWA